MKTNYDYSSQNREAQNREAQSRNARSRNSQPLHVLVQNRVDYLFDYSEWGDY